jgi:hypothetical protein
MAKKTCHGSCHCQRIRYEADLDLAAPVRHMNGRNDDWFHTPAETRHL